MSLLPITMLLGSLRMLLTRNLFLPVIDYIFGTRIEARIHHHKMGISQLTRIYFLICTRRNPILTCQVSYLEVISKFIMQHSLTFSSFDYQDNVCATCNAASLSIHGPLATICITI